MGQIKELRQELEQLRLRLAEVEQTLEAIRAGQVDSLVVEGPEGLRVYALEGASNTYRVLIEAMNEGAATITETGVILYCNSRLARVLELPLQRVMGGSIYEYVTRRFRATLEALLKAAEREESRGEIRFVSSRGEEIPVYLSLNKIEADGRPIVCMVAVDLRPQRRTEEILAAERLASSIIDQTAEATIVCDEAGRIVRASATALKLSDANPMFAPFEEAFPVSVSGARSSRALMLAVLRGEAFRATPATLRQRDGSERELLMSAKPLQGISGRVVGGVFTLVDVTEVRLAEEALRESEERFRTLANNIPQLVWMADEHGNRFWHNQRWSEYTGMSPAELNASGWQKVLHPEHRERVVRNMSRCFRAAEALEDTLPLRGKNGRYRWFLMRIVPVRGVNNRIVRWFCTHTDITSQRETEMALREAVSIRDNFLSVASHELRTPLTALTLQLGGLRKILSQLSNGEERFSKRLETAIRQAERLNLLIEGLLNVSRIASGRLRLELEQCDLAEVVCEAIERTGELAANAGCEVRFSPSGALIGIWDRSRLDQVVVNLLSNAVKYGAGHPIDVSIASDGESVEIRVRDYGIGISEGDQRRIFNRFERAVSSAHYGGLGLGLYITREIVQALGGSIRVESTTGQGAAFIVRLPRESKPAVEHMETAS